MTAPSIAHAAQIWRHPIKSLGALEVDFGYKDFGVNCEVVAGAPIAERDPDGLV